MTDLNPPVSDPPVADQPIPDPSGAEAAQPPKPSPAQSSSPWQREPVRISGRASPRRYDWPQAAKLLAVGTPAAEVAEALGCDEARVWRHLQASATFRAMVEKEAERNRLLHGLRLQELQRDFAEALYARQDHAPETIERMAAAQPEVTGTQLAAAARRARAPGSRKVTLLSGEKESIRAGLRANQIIREAAAARRELREAMAPARVPAASAAAPVTKTPECPGSTAKLSEASGKPGDADAGQGEAMRKPPPVWPPPPKTYPLVPEGCEYLYYYGTRVPIMPEYWGKEMAEGWSITPNPRSPEPPPCDVEPDDTDT
ncbi:hypothetical protein V6B08_10670 [Ferrovibrio sp. MS7]|uniref:hypothetical protein n=1 Tax=Ferrovibrio plantarum TaxID=3119164 RepID=UPI00313602DF